MLFRMLFLLAFLAVPVAAVSQDIGTVNFDFDSAELDAEALATISEIATRLKENPSYKQTVVVGFTDAVGGLGYNDSLGLRRARAVSDALRNEGVEVDRIGDVSSRGKRELLVNVTGPERLNRRVTVTLGDMLQACRSFREIPLTTSSVGAELQTDIEQRLSEADQFYDQLAVVRQTGAAFQMAGAAREDCFVAAGYDSDSLRKVEYAKRCFCSSARMRVALQ
ncbi:MAG: OmpA family protein [Roseobacter sp.]